MYFLANEYDVKYTILLMIRSTSLQIFGVERKVYLLVNFTTYVIYRHGIVHGKAHSKKKNHWSSVTRET